MPAHGPGCLVRGLMSHSKSVVTDQTQHCRLLYGADGLIWRDHKPRPHLGCHHKRRVEIVSLLIEPRPLDPPAS